MYSGEYTSGCSRPAASHLAAPLLPRHEGYVGQAPRPSRLNALLANAQEPKTESEQAGNQHRFIVRPQKLWPTIPISPPE
jgi:hypothetical protein